MQIRPMHLWCIAALACGGGGSAPDAGDASAPTDSPSSDSTSDSASDATSTSCPVLPLVGPGAFSVAWVSAVSGGDYVASVRADASGNVYALPADSNGNPNVVVTKLDPSGAVLWKIPLMQEKNDAGRSGSVTAASVLVDSAGDPIVIGTFTFSVSFGGDVRSAAPAGNQTPNAVFVMKLSAASGATTFLKTFDAVNTTVAGATLDAAGHIWVAGTFSMPINFGGSNLTTRGVFDIFALELDATGNHLFSASYGSSGNDAVAGIAPGANGGTVIAGNIAATSGSLGGATLTSYGTFVAGYDTNGALGWSVFPTTFGTPSDIVTDANGDIFLTGSSSSGSYVARLGPTAQPGFVTQLGAPVGLLRVAVDGAGNVAAAGLATAGSTTFGNSTFVIPQTSGTNGLVQGVVVRLDASGNPISARAFGGGCSKYDNSTDGEDSYAKAVAFDPSGKLIVGAGVAGNVDFGSGPVLRTTREATVFAVSP